MIAFLRKMPPILSSQLFPENEAESLHRNPFLVVGKAQISYSVYSV